MTLDIVIRMRGIWMTMKLSFPPLLISCFFAFLLSSPYAIALSTDITLSAHQANGKKVELTVSLEQIEQLPQTIITTQLPWINGQAAFKGVKLSTLLEMHSIKPSLIRLKALNDYTTEVTWQEMLQYEPIIAIKKDEQYLKIRDYGPFWLIFPLDQYTELQQTTYLAKMIWQLESIKVE
jgi:hypothetical protein